MGRLRLFVAFELILLLSGVSCHPSGAGSSACSDLTPGHGNVAQTSVSPYSVTTSTGQYSAGGTVTVTLSGDRSFKGLLLVATNSSSGDVSQTVGSLEGSTPTDASLIQKLCTDNRAVTHNQPLSTDKLRITWTAPSQLVGNIYFYATFVQDTATYWVKVPSRGIWDGVSDQPVTPTTTTPKSTGVIGTFTGSITLDGCGESKSCWRNCQGNANKCDHLVTWTKDESDEKFNFEIFAANVDGYVALGIAPGITMSDVSIIACVADENNGVQQYYAATKSQPEKIESGPINTSPSEFSYDREKRTMSCKFTYDNSVAKNDLTKWKDLSQGTHRLLLARGLYANQIQKHRENPPPSPENVKFLIVTDFGGTAVQALVKAHGALMILAWVLCASIGIIMARYYKPLWVNKKACGQKIWFQVHRSLMLAAMFISLIAFVLILIHKNGKYDLPENLPRRAHPVLGLIAIIFSFLNPLIAAFRCHPGDKKRPIFNWFHWFFGTVAHIFGVVAIFLGMMFDSAEVPGWLVYVMMAYTIVHVCFEFILEIHNCCKYDKNRDRREQFELSGAPSTEEPKFAGRKFRCFMLIIYLILVTILSLVMVFVVAFVRG